MPKTQPASWQSWSPLQYSPRELAGDLTGGLVAALIAMPYGLAMAALMGLPPTMGLMTSVITAPICALLGRNPVLIGGTSTVTVPFIAAAVQAQGPAGAAKITIVAGIFLMIFCVLRWGSYITKVPLPVVSGFSCGIGAMMIISQLRTLFGLRIAAGGSMLDQLWNAMVNLPSFNWQVTALAFTTIFGAALCGRVLPNAPAPMLGILAAVGCGSLFGWHDKEVGALSLSLPPLAKFTWSPADTLQLIPSALGLAIVTSVNLLITSRVVEHFRGRHQHLKRSDADRELGAYGIAKAALLALMRQYALEQGGSGVRVNGLNADRIRSGLLDDGLIQERAAARGVSEAAYMAGNLLGAEVRATDVAEAFVALALMQRTTGALLTVDGGNVAAMVR